jgi:transposase-like protein
LLNKYQTEEDEPWLITITEELLQGLFLSNGRDEAFSKLLEEIFNQILLAQSTEQIGAEPYERTEERAAYRNGFRDRQMTTRVGTLTLRVPRHRNDSSIQSFLPDTSAVNKR